MKKLTLLLIALVMLMGCAPVSKPLSVQEEANIDGYFSDNRNVEIYKITRNSQEVSVWLNFPDTLFYLYSQPAIERIATNGAYDIAGFYDYHTDVGVVCVHVITPNEEASEVDPIS